MAHFHPSRPKRRPIRNFIILPDLQWPYIIRMMAIVNLAGVVMAAAICAFFYLGYITGPAAPYAAGGMVERGLVDQLVEKHLMEAILPAFVIADMLSLAMGLGLALYFSRKISVPIYRIHRWAEAIAAGDLSYRLKFRPGDDLRSLEESCNLASAAYLEIIADLRGRLAEAELPLPDRPERARTAAPHARHPGAASPDQNA